MLSNTGKLELVLEDPDLIGSLKERWIAAEAAKRLDYSIFMAVSERGGKNNSGDYEYRLDEDGSLVEFPLAGQLLGLGGELLLALLVLRIQVGLVTLELLARFGKLCLSVG